MDGAEAELWLRYGDKMSKRHPWIEKAAYRSLLVCFISAMLWFLNADFGHILFSSTKVLLVLSILLKIVATYSGVIGSITLTLYWLWNIALEAFHGIRQSVYIAVLCIFSVAVPFFIPSMYDSAIDKIKPLGTSDIVYDVKYVVKCISGTDTTTTKSITFDNNSLKGQSYDNICYYLRLSNEYRSEYVILPYDDAKELLSRSSGNEKSELTVTYEISTKIVVGIHYP